MLAESATALGFGVCGALVALLLVLFVRGYCRTGSARGALGEMASRCLPYGKMADLGAKLSPGVTAGTLSGVQQEIVRAVGCDVIIDARFIELGAVVASGGAGQIYKAKYGTADVACKAVFSQLLAEEVGDIVNEFEVLRQSAHPHVVTLHGFALVDQKVLMITEWVDTSLADILDSCGGGGGPSKRRLAGGGGARAGASGSHRVSRASFADLAAMMGVGAKRRDSQLQQDTAREQHTSPELRLTWLLQLSTTIEYLHSKGIVHRDIKPENILVGKNMEVKICDFGMARHIDERMTVGLGTPLYMPQEVLLAGTGYASYAGEAWDVYSFSILASELLNFRRAGVPGVSPVALAIRACAEGWRPSLPKKMQPIAGSQLAALDIPPHVVRIIQAGWHAEPKARPSFSQITACLQSWQQEQQQRRVGVLDIVVNPLAPARDCTGTAAAAAGLRLPVDDNGEGNDSGGTGTDFTRRVIHEDPWTGASADCNPTQDKADRALSCPRVNAAVLARPVLALAIEHHDVRAPRSGPSEVRRTRMQARLTGRASVVSPVRACV